MRLLTLVFIICSNLNFLLAQTVSVRLQQAYQRFEKDEQLKYASHSLYVLERATGRLVFARHENLGLAPASTQKVITAATAYALLKPGFRYSNTMGYTGHIAGDKGGGQLIFYPSGDPSWGSNRYSTTNPGYLLPAIADSLRKQGIKWIAGKMLLVAPGNTDPQSIPDGWIWQDLGNYYGAGAGLLNWKENQFDILLRSGASIGGPVSIINSSNLPGEVDRIDNRLTAAAAGTGDNAYLYPALADGPQLLKGTIPVNQNQFSISGSILYGDKYFAEDLHKFLGAQGYIRDSILQVTPASDIPLPNTIIARFFSPSLDSISYWFLKKSINLYGEALIRTIGEKVRDNNSTESGLTSMRQFWSKLGIDSNTLRVQDGSGLSPQNRVTSKTMVAVLQYAGKQSWFNSYYDGFPLYNGMRMKSGTISGVKGFCGFHTSKRDGKEYVFAFLVNNYSGSAGSLVRKMYEVLDVLK